MSEGLRLGPMQLDVGLQTAERNVKTLNFICDSCATKPRAFLCRSRHIQAF